MHPALAALAGADAMSKHAIDRFLRRHRFPLVDEEGATFVFRGEADEVRLQHWVFGLPAAQPLRRLSGSDLWYLRIELPAGSRVEYKFDVHTQGGNAWVVDPLNPLRAHDPFGENSVCQGHGYVEPDWTQADPGTRPGRTERVALQSRAFGDERFAEVYLPARFRPSRRYPLLIVHDGLDFMHYGSLKTVLDNLIDRLDVFPLVAALTNSGDRTTEYAADDRQASFLCEELVPALEQRFPLQRDPDSRVLMGASFGAVATLHAAWRYPGFYNGLILLSGSFAFADIGHHGRSAVFDPVAEFVNTFRADPGTPVKSAYLSCGIYESLIYENRAMAPLLQRHGIDVRYSEVRDGHNWENWRDRMQDALGWHFPGESWMVYE